MEASKEKYVRQELRKFFDYNGDGTWGDRDELVDGVNMPNFMDDVIEMIDALDNGNVTIESKDREPYTFNVINIEGFSIDERKNEIWIKERGFEGGVIIVKNVIGEIKEKGKEIAVKFAQIKS